jgi:membrane protease YdiL (CAAX protease family)
MLTKVTAVIFTLALVAGLPALSYATARNREIRSLPRQGLYFSAVFSQWLLTAVAVGVVLLIAPKVIVIGFAVMPLRAALGWGAGIAAAALLGLSLVLEWERRGWLPHESDLVYRLIPETAREKLWAALIVAPTAAFCEEFLYRGYLLAQMRDWLHSLGWAWVVASVAFGLAHFYQGWSGMVRAGLLGALLAWPVARWGSLYPAILAHWMIDTVSLLWLSRWMMREDAFQPPLDPGAP